jgi:hypothetical protein
LTSTRTELFTNRVNWLNIGWYIAALQCGTCSYDRYRICLLLHIALIEYMNGGSKSLVLLYLVYNAADTRRHLPDSLDVQPLVHTLAV